MLAADSSIAGYLGRWRPASVLPEAAAFARQVVAGCRPPGRKARDDHHAADAHKPIAPLRRSVAGSSALARRHPRIIGNPPTPAAAAANRLASASHHHPHATLQPTDCLILLPQRLPAAVETSIARPTTPPSALSHTRSFNRACAPVQGAQTLIRFFDSTCDALRLLHQIPSLGEGRA